MLPRNKTTLPPNEHPPCSRWGNAARRGQSLAVWLIACLLLASLVATLGCQDGPMYALKHANPYFTRQWSRDEALGVTDHTRRQELLSLVDQIERMPTERQQYWSGHLDQIYKNDASAEMRRLAIVAAGKSSDPAAMSILSGGLDDESLKVRMEACRALGNRSGDEPARMLAAVLGKTQDKDVRHAAIAALANHPGEIANGALKLALDDRDPATQTLVIASLRDTMGKDYGMDPKTWIAALDGKPVDEQPAQGRFGSLF